jgi:hypothetical protein
MILHDVHIVQDQGGDLEEEEASGIQFRVKRQLADITGWIVEWRFQGSSNIPKNTFIRNAQLNNEIK